jgi:phosphoribosylaminoimidazole carboxylase (NCAIR synthetase)
MKRVLIAASRNWTGVSRLPSTLGPAGFTIDLMDRGGTQASSSRWISKRTAVTGDVSVLVSRLLEVADDYDRVIVCDEPLLNALVDSADNRAHALLPASTDMLAIMLDKTAFPAFLRAVGVCVAPSVVVEAEVGMAVALAEIGLPAYIKGRQGFGGTVVKRVRQSPSTATPCSSSMPSSPDRA